MQATTAASGGGSTGLPAHVLMGYWQDFTNNAEPLTLAQVPTSYNLVAVAFGTATGTPGQALGQLSSGDPGLIITLAPQTIDMQSTGASCGSFVPPSTYPDIRGAMTWSINWDASNGCNFADTVGPHLSSPP